jgi:glycosyltransferase involved in cell wall biosynthesis
MTVTSSAAVVHEWVAGRAGSEKVFEALANVLPTADLLALSREPAVELDVGGRNIRTSMLDSTTLRGRRSLTLPLMPTAWRHMGRARYSHVVTSHHACAAHNRLASEVHLAYVHSPMRYVWSPELDHRGANRYLAAPRAAMKFLDLRAARRLTDIAANSREVASRIERFWGREARVIHPPVDTPFFRPGAEMDDDSLPADYLLGFGRWIDYKRLDLVIDVGARLRVPVVIAGGGPLGPALKAHAASSGTQVNFVEHPSQLEVRRLLRRARALVFPTLEDFGIVPVEAQACGTPVVALAAGGALETVAHQRTGLLVPELRAEAFAEAVEGLGTTSTQECREWAVQFSAERFQVEVAEWLRAYDFPGVLPAHLPDVVPS